MKITYIEVKNVAQPEDENIEGWAILFNGRLIATDSYQDSLTCGEVAENLARALGTSVEERTVEVSGRWSWVRDVLPKLDVRPERPVDQKGNLLTSEDRNAIAIACEFCMAAVKRGVADAILDDMDLSDNAFQEALDRLNRLW